MSKAITEFYKGAEFGNRVAYDVASGQAVPSRAKWAYREWSQPISFTDGTAEVPLKFTFPAICAVTMAAVYVRTAEAGGTTKRINVGTATADSGSPNAFLNGVDVSVTGLRTLSNTQPIAITVTASPFTYTSVGSSVVVVQGGTVSVIALVRGGTSTTTGLTSGVFTLSDGDSIVVTYSVLPTMTALPFNDPDMVSSSNALLILGGKRLSWTPASANFTTLVADLIIDYIVFDDETLPLNENTNIIMGPSD